MWKGRDNIERMREGRGSVLRSDPAPSRFLAARSLRKLFEAMLSACNRHGDHVAGITFVRPTLFSNRGERARPALFATFSPVRSRFPSSCRDGQKLRPGLRPFRFHSREKIFQIFFLERKYVESWNHRWKFVRRSQWSAKEGNLSSEKLKSSFESYQNHRNIVCKI